MGAHSVIGRGNKKTMAELDVDTENSTWSQQGSFQRHLLKEVLKKLVFLCNFQEQFILLRTALFLLMSSKLDWEKKTVINSN